MRRFVALPALAAAALLAPSASAAPKPPPPQIQDIANDANLLNGQDVSYLSEVPNNRQTPGASQSYADVLSVRWQAVKTSKKVKKKTVTTVTGFTVTATLAAPPTPPAGTTIVYRTTGSTEFCTTFGVVYYSTKTSNDPQSALVDRCNGSAATRLTPIGAPAVSGNTLTWSVPLSAIPRDASVRAGTVVNSLSFTTSAIVDLRGQRVPDGVPNRGGATSVVVGIIDDAKPGTTPFPIA